MTDRESRQRLLKDQELLPHIVQWVSETPGWASQTEFHAFWVTINRLGSTGEKGYLDEHAFMEYLTRHVFDMSKDLVQGNFQYGLGKVPLGTTAFATNAMETKFHCFKNMMRKGFVSQDAT